MYDIIF